MRCKNQMPFVDFSMNMMLFFCCICALAFLAIKQEQKKKEDDGNIQSSYKYIVNLTWENESDADIDMGLVDPNQKFCFFSCKEIPFIALDRDDVGFSTDVYQSGGYTAEIKENKETFYIRELIPGRYRINAWAFNMRSDDKVFVKIEFIDLANRRGKVYENSTEFTTSGQEDTLITFEFHEDRTITFLDNVDIKMVR